MPQMQQALSSSHPLPPHHVASLPSLRLRLSTQPCGSAPPPKSHFSYRSPTLIRPNCKWSRHAPNATGALIFSPAPPPSCSFPPIPSAPPVHSTVRLGSTSKIPLFL